MKKYTVKAESKLKNRESSLRSDFKKTTVHLKNAKGMKVSSSNWLRRHINDSFVQMSKEEGYISRAAYKIIEIFEKFRILKKNNEVILDLGCSPGSWSQAVNEIFKYTVKIIGVDLLECSYSNHNFTFIKGDFESKETQNRILEELKGKKLNLIISDIAHNAIGESESDRIVNIRMIESCLDFIKENLTQEGNFIVKTLYGSYQNLILDLKKIFNEVYLFKPQASRKTSTEQYIICIGKK